MKSDVSKFKLDRSKKELDQSELKILDKMSKEDVKELIEFHEKQHNYYKAIEQGTKVALNSIYGAFGNPYFVCSTTDISYAITAMGRNLLRHMDTMVETYFYEYWHEDTELHEKLGIDSSKVKKIDSSWIHRESKQPHEGEVTEHDVIEGLYQRRVPTCLYGDTDSAFIGYQPAMDSCDWERVKGPGHEQEFIEIVAKNRLEPLLKKKLDTYAKKYHVKNLQDFELENMNESILFLAKKSYIKHTIWEEGVQYKRLENLVPKNVSLIKRGTPPFAREKVLEIVNYIFDNHKYIKLNEILKFIRDQRKQFEMIDNKDEIAESTSVNMYASHKIVVDGQMTDGPGIVSDNGSFVVAKGTYYTVKAAGLYNYLLNNNVNLKVKYETITPGTKVKMYPCFHDLNNRFAYPLGLYPKEFAPPIDYDELFEKTVSAQVNVFLKSLGLPELNKRLKVVMPVF